MPRLGGHPLEADVAYYTTAQEVLQHWTEDRPTMNAARVGVIVDTIGDISDQFDLEARNLRSEGEGWTFPGSQLYGVQQVSIIGVNVSGTYTLTFGSLTSAAIAYNAAAAAVQTQTDAICGAGNTVVSGPPGGPWTITFAGTLSGSQPTFVAISSLTSSVPGAGTFGANLPVAIVEPLVVGTFATTTRRYSGQGGRILPIDDALEIASVALINSDGTLVQNLTLGTDYLPYPLNSLPIVGLTRVGGRWPFIAGGVSVVLRPGYSVQVPSPIHKGIIVEVIRAVRVLSAGLDDRQGVDPLQAQPITPAFLSATNRILYRYRYGGGMVRRIE